MNVTYLQTLLLFAGGNLPTTSIQTQDDVIASCAFSDWKEHFRHACLLLDKKDLYTRSPGTKVYASPSTCDSCGIATASDLGVSLGIKGYSLRIVVVRILSHFM